MTSCTWTTQCHGSFPDFSTSHREMRARVRVRIVNFHVLTRPRVFAQRLPYSAQYVDGVVGTLKGTHNLYQQKALARWIQLTLILTQKKIRGSTAGRDQIRRVRRSCPLRHFETSLFSLLSPFGLP
jgi:hypothetical protein